MPTNTSKNVTASLHAMGLAMKKKRLDVCGSLAESQQNVREKIQRLESIAHVSPFIVIKATEC